MFDQSVIGTPGTLHLGKTALDTGLLTTGSGVRVLSGEPNVTLGETIALWLTGGARESRRTGVALRAAAVIHLFN